MSKDEVMLIKVVLDDVKSFLDKIGERRSVIPLVDVGRMNFMNDIDNEWEYFKNSILKEVSKK